VFFFLDFSHPPSLKTHFLEFLLQMTKHEKKLPLNFKQRAKLVKALLHDDVRKFDFATLGNQNYFEYFRSVNIFDDLWTHLAENCPNLIEIRERLSYFEPQFGKSTPPKLNKKIAAFPNLLSLETDCYLTTGC